MDAAAETEQVPLLRDGGEPNNGDNEVPLDDGDVEVFNRPGEIGEDFIIEDEESCCTLNKFGGCTKNDVAQFVLYDLLFLGSLADALLLFLSRKTGHNRFLPAASLSPDTIIEVSGGSECGFVPRHCGNKGHLC